MSIIDIEQTTLRQSEGSQTQTVALGCFVSSTVCCSSLLATLISMAPPRNSSLPPIQHLGA